MCWTGSVGSSVFISGVANSGCAGAVGLVKHWLMRAVRRWPLEVAMIFGKCARTSLLVRPGHVLKNPASMAAIHVLGKVLKHALWRYDKMSCCLSKA